VKVLVNFFKESGKLAGSEWVEVPENTFPWDLRLFIPAKPYEGLSAVTEGPTPWGYPQMVPSNRRFP